MHSRRNQMYQLHELEVTLKKTIRSEENDNRKV